MISAIEGKLVKLDSETASVQVGALTYEIMLPGYCIALLADKIGSQISLCTMEYYEGNVVGGNLIPRMVGFTNTFEREFFLKFTSVKGIGIKKALRLLSMPIATIASAIETGDNKILMSLEGVGKRMAEQIIVELKGKLGKFAMTEAAVTSEIKFKPFQAEALEILIAWGEKRNEAMELIELACQKYPDIKSAEQLVPLVYKLKQGIAV